MTVRVCVTGAGGRVGSLVVDLLRDDARATLVGAVEAPGSPRCGKSVPGHNNLVYVDNISSIEHFDLLIDFSTPGALRAISDEALKRGSSLLIATTGHGAEGHLLLEKVSKSVPVLLAPNTSLGIMALREISVLAQRILGDRFDIEIVESHRREKKDSPSGTALFLGKALAEVSGGGVVFGEEATTRERRAGEVGLMSIRGGDTPGEHTIYFLGESEEVRITHTVRDRRVFARGAIELGLLLRMRGPGSYSVSDLAKSQ